MYVFIRATGAGFRAWQGGLTLLVAATGCAVHRPGLETYRLIKQTSGQVLVPPGVSDPDLGQRTFTVDVVPSPGPCVRTGSGIDIRRRRKNVRVTVTRDFLLRQPPGGLSTWGEEAESQGCLRPGDGPKLASRIAESLPLPPNTGVGLLRASDRRAGYVDLGPDDRLKVVSPILRDGASPDAAILEPVKTTGTGTSLTLELKTTPDFLGYETAWFAVQPKPDRAGFAIIPISAERYIQGSLERRPEPATNYFRFSPQAAFYRLLYKADRNDEVIREIVIAGVTRADLDRRSQAVAQDPDSCEKAAERMCVVIPMRVALNPHVVATVNGREVTIPVGGTVRDAIASAGERDPRRVLPKLTVSRLYSGRPVEVQFERNSQDILSLVLTGGERIYWE